MGRTLGVGELAGMLLSVFVEVWSLFIWARFFGMKICSQQPEDLTKAIFFLIGLALKVTEVGAEFLDSLYESGDERRITERREG
ncbi:hypothetical protein V8E55_005104, partial [Tylopilus felleus]